MLRLACIAVLTFSGIVTAQAPSANADPKADIAISRRFDAVSIRPSAAGEVARIAPGPSGFFTNNVSLSAAVMYAYFPFTRILGTSSPFTGAPGWMSKDRYDIEAKFDEQTAQAFKNATSSQREEMLHPLLQAMLAERCKLAAHMTMVDTPVYELVVGKHGPKLKETASDEAPPEHGIRIGDIAMWVPIYPKPAKQQITYFRISMAELATQLSVYTDRQIVDRTGLSGRYDLTLPKVLPDPADRANGVPPNPDPMAIWDLSVSGLELRPARAPQPMLVIDHIEKPSEN